MGDKNINHEREEVDQEKESGSSLKPLRSIRPSENISILDHPSRDSEEIVEKIHDEEPDQTLSVVDSEAKVETFFEKILEPSRSENKKLVEKIDTTSEVVQPQTETTTEPTTDATKHIDESPIEKTMPVSLEKKHRIGSAASGVIQSERILRNQSDIFSLKEQTSVANAIFSINGSPSRKVFRRKEAPASNVFPFGQEAGEEPPLEKVILPKEKSAKECYNELTRPSGSARNPLTGTGLSSNDEYKFKGSKRKDGNPLLGLGYSPEATPSAHRIPPGGFSHKLW